MQQPSLRHALSMRQSIESTDRQLLPQKDAAVFIGGKKMTSKFGRPLRYKCSKHTAKQFLVTSKHWANVRQQSSLMKSTGSGSTQRLRGIQMDIRCSSPTNTRITVKRELEWRTTTKTILRTRPPRRSLSQATLVVPTVVKKKLHTYASVQTKVKRGCSRRTSTNSYSGWGKIMKQMSKYYIGCQSIFCAEKQGSSRNRGQCDRRCGS